MGGGDVQVFLKPAVGEDVSIHSEKQEGGLMQPLFLTHALYVSTRTQAAEMMGKL